MSIEYQNFQLDGYSFDDYFQALISPVQYDKKPEAMMMELNKYKDTNNSELKNPMPKLEYPNIHPYLLMQQNNMMSNNNVMHNEQQQTKTTNKRKSIAESRDLVVVEEEEETDSSSISSSPKKTKKNTKTTTPKKKKEAPKRKRVNYCFEIHRSGCQMNKDSKLYCKVFLKGKLQSEVDLIKGARGKWAYTFYDQRKNKKERRYWPSQSSGPVIEDPCNCGACIPNNPKKINNKINNTPIIENNEEAEFSSPSTEEATLIEYDNPQPQNIDESNQYQNEYQQVTNIPHYVEQQNHIVYYTLPPNYQTNEVQEYNQYSIKTSNDYQNLVLKSSNDFQDRNHYLKSSNDYIMNQQRNWEVQNNNNYNTNMNEYQNDNFFVENHFL